ncbi:MAG TPA: winged helix-turn-helix domain-containing protein [Thermoanaerobaculia bacterium]|jgi:ATP-dependent DNA helicase RecG|nr:winged helix-turn-helix domain-containing protein [Thermoanaerobaculia bacterium]
MSFRSPITIRTSCGCSSISDAGTPEPILCFESNDIWIEFPFSTEYIETLRSSGPGQSNQGLAEKWGEKWGEKIMGKRLRIARAMLRNPRISTVALAAELGMATSGIEKHLKVMREDGAIRRIGPARSGHWEVIP